MPAQVDNPTLAVAVERPNIFAAPASDTTDSSVGAEAGDGGSVFTRTPPARQRDRKSARLRRASLGTRASLLIGGGMSLRGCVFLATVVAAAVARLVLHEAGSSAPAQHAHTPAGTRVDTGSLAPSHPPARLRSRHARESVVPAHPNRRRQASSRVRRSAARSRCCRRRSSRRGAGSVAPAYRRRAVPAEPTTSATTGAQSAAPAAPRDHGTPMPVPAGTPPEFM
jgi:hypothetical protein